MFKNIYIILFNELLISTILTLLVKCIVIKYLYLLSMAFPVQEITLLTKPQNPDL